MHIGALRFFRATSREKIRLNPARIFAERSLNGNPSAPALHLAFETGHRYAPGYVKFK